MNPLALGATGAAVAALAGVALVFALYLMKPPLRRFLVPSSLIWERVLRQTHAGRDRLRWWLSVLLAALIVLALLIAVVRPQLVPGGAGGGRLVVVIDNSPTLATRTTDGSTRWEHAVARARRLLQEQGAGTQVWLADSMRRIAMPAFEGRDAALERLSKLNVAHGDTPRVPLPPAEVGGSDMRLVVVTDGVQLTGVPGDAHVESVFEAVENAGITAFELRPVPANPQRVQAFVETTNGGGTSKQVALTLSGLGGRRVTRTFDIPAGGSHAELLDVSEFESGPVRASLSVPGDGLPADDDAYAWLPLRRIVRVILVTEGNPWLEKALQAQPRVLLTVMPPSSYADSRDVDAWVLDRYTPRVAPAAPALLFHPSRAAWLPPQSGEVANPVVTAWDASHPVLENVSLGDLYIERAQKTAARQNAADTVLIAAGAKTPLAWVQDSGTRRVAFGFALEQSNFALHAAFPVFLNNALNWMTAEPTLLKSGLGVLELPLENARLIGADGAELDVQPIPHGGLAEMTKPGFYTAVNAGERLRIAVNVLDRKTTEVNRSPLKPMTASREAKADVSPARVDPWLILLLGALVLLCLEWLGWNRRVTL